MSASRSTWVIDTSLTTVLLVGLTASTPALLRAQEPADAFRHPASWDEWLVPVRDPVSESPQPQAAACRLWVREVGEGPRAVFLHGGWGADHEDLLYGFLPLAGDLRLTFYDQRGSLRSPCDEPPTAQDHITDLEELRRALGERRLILVGHSMGTWLAMAYAEAHPDRVAGLVLLAPVWPTPEAPGVEPSPRWERPEVAAELAREGLELPRRRADGPRGWSVNHRIIFAAVNLHDVTKWRAVRPPWAYATDAANSAARSMPEDYDFRPALAALDVPVLVVQGDDDYLPAATWTDEIPGVERVEVDEAGHVPYIDRPDRVRELVRDFVLAVAGEQ
jgi:pimeloyl-ACP methyl ester carboxylesterase